jgi:hypothetical protein
MPILDCKSCGRKNQAPDTAVGKKGKCAACGAIMVIPALDEAEPVINMTAVEPPPLSAAGTAEPPPPPAVSPPLPSQADVTHEPTPRQAKKGEQGCGNFVLFVGVIVLVRLITVGQADAGTILLVVLGAFLIAYLVEQVGKK